MKWEEKMNIRYVIDKKTRVIKGRYNNPLTKDEEIWEYPHNIAFFDEKSGLSKFIASENGTLKERDLTKVPEWIEWYNENIIKERKKAYYNEADPLFFEFKAGEGTEENWLNKRNEIKMRYIKKES